VSTVWGVFRSLSSDSPKRAGVCCLDKKLPAAAPSGRWTASTLSRRRPSSLRDGELKAGDSGSRTRAHTSPMLY